MKKLILLTLILVSFACCKKKYTYVEISKEYGSVLETEEPIKARNDSIAYLAAYRKFCISLSAESGVRGVGYPDYSRVLGFVLLDRNGQKVTSPMQILSMIKKVEEVENSVFGFLVIDSVAKVKLYNFKTLELLINN